MTHSDGLAIAAILICFVVSVALLAIESALTRASRPRLHAQGEAGDAKAAAAAALLEQRDILVSALRLGQSRRPRCSPPPAPPPCSTTAGASPACWRRWRSGSWCSSSPAACRGRFPRAIPTASPRWSPRLRRSSSPSSCRSPRCSTPSGGSSLWPFDRRTRRRPRERDGTEELRGAVDLMHREGAVVKEDRDMLGGLLGARRSSRSPT